MRLNRSGWEWHTQCESVGVRKLKNSFILHNHVQQNSRAGLSCVQAELKSKETLLVRYLYQNFLIQIKNILFEKKEDQSKETLKPRRNKLSLWLSTAFPSMGIRLWRCIDSFGSTSRVTFECCVYISTSTVRWKIVKEKRKYRVEKFFF